MATHTGLRLLRSLFMRSLHLLTLVCLLFSWLPAQAAGPRLPVESAVVAGPASENLPTFAGLDTTIPQPAQEISATLTTPTLAASDPAAVATPITATLEAPVDLPSETQTIQTTPAPPTPPIHIPASGGIAEGLGGRVRVTFPAQVEALEVTIRPPATPPPSSPGGRSFEVVAVNQSGQEVKSFPNPLTLEVYYDEATLEGPEESLQLRYYDEALGDWLGVATWVDADQNRLRARLDHLTVFDTGYLDWEAARLPSLQPFQTAPFTGAATYSLDLWTPPGPGGLQPNLSLSYNSQVVDNVIASQTQASWVGMGWSLDTGGIERNQNGTPRYTGDDTFSISAGGVDSLLLKGDDGYYHTVDETFWRIQYDAANDAWTAWTKDGTKYVFGDTGETRASYPADYGCQGNNPVVYPKTWRWGLHSVTNVHSQSLVYTYTQSKHTHTFEIEPCGVGEYETTIWLYPSEILYPAQSPYKVVFELADRQDYRPGWSQPETYTFFMKKRLQGVRIERQGQTVRRYNLGYNLDSQGLILPGIVWKSSPNVFTLTLLSLQEQGLNGAALPATTFTYADGLHLTQAANGYGGVVGFTYDSTPWHEITATKATEIDRAKTDKTQQEVGCSSDEYTLEPTGGGQVTCDDRDRQLLQGSAYLDLPGGFQQPGAVYRLTIEVVRRGSGTTDVTLSLGDLPILTQTVGASAFKWLSGYKTLPANASLARLKVKCTNLCWVRNMKWELLTTRYRVRQKSLDDPADNTPPALFSYRYDEPATNDTLHSAFAATAHPFILPNAEFRGHAMTQEIGPDGRVTTTFQHQDDARKGRAPASLTSWEEFGDDFEAGYNGASWQACSGSDFSVPVNASDPLDRVNNFLRGDRALRLVGDGSWRCGYRNNNGTLGDGEGLLAQFLVSGSTAQAKMALEAGAYQWGVKLDGAGALKAYRSDISEPNQPILIPAGSFKRDTWYSLLLLADQEGFVTRVWERDNPWVSGVYSASFRAGLSWRLRLEAQNGTLWADTLSEGRFYTEMTSQLTPVARGLWPTQPCADGYCFSGLGVYWVRLDAEQATAYAEGGVGFSATRAWHAYDAFANRTRTQQAGWNAGLGRWDDYRIEVSGYYPNSGASYLVGLPGYTNTYACPEGSINGACLNAAPPYSLITSSTWYLYDGSPSYSTPPVAGKQTGQRRLLRHAGPNYSEARFQDQQMAYDAYGNLAAGTLYTGEGTSSLLWQGQARTTSYSYDPTHHTYLLTETPPITELDTDYTYNYNLGLPITLTGPNGPSTTITVTYDTFGRVLNLVRPGDDPGNPTLQAIYHDPALASERLWVELRQRVQGSQYAAWRKFYNGLGQLIQSQTMGAQVWDTGSGTEVSRTLLQDAWYDAYGQVVRQSVPYSSTLSGGYITPNLNMPATLTSYDALGRIVQATAPDTTPTTYTYLDLETRVADAPGNTTRTLFDVWGRTKQVIPPTGPDVSYNYDTRDQLLSASRGGATTTLEYDYAGRKTRMVDPDMGEWTYAYDPLGYLTRQRDAKQQRICMYYDPINRLVGKYYHTDDNCPASPSYNASYFYDEPGYGYSKGQRTRMQDSSGSTTWTYDDRGRMVTESKTISGQNYLTQWGYNSADLPVSMTYPVDNEVVTYTYKPQLLLNSTTGANTYVSSTIYDSANRMTARSLGNGLTQAFNYNPWTSQGGRLGTMTAGSLQSLTYQYDPVGNITQIQDAITSETQTFGYDALYRLTSATTSGGLAPYSESYTYDVTTGNLTSKGGVSYTYDPNHPHAVASLSNGNIYQHDLNGNQVTRNIGSDSFTLLYDAENHLVEVKKNGLTIATFTYDGDGKRVKSVIGGETILFIGRHYEVVNGSATKYYFAGDQRIALRKNATLSYLLSDHLGSTSITTDASGNKISELKYKAWGEVRYSSGAQITDYTYTDQYSNVDAFGLLFYGARWYDPALARWTQPDNIIPEPINTLAWDRFSYGANNPIRYKDPSGHWIETALDIAFIAYDLYQINQEGWTLVNTVALAADVACAIVPIGTGGGPAVRAIMAGSNAALAFTKTATKLPDAILAGQMLEKIFQFASSSSKDSLKDLQGHHPWPKYLLGPENQELYGLDKKLHTEYHTQLDKFLDRKLGQEYFQKLIDTPEKLNDLLEALLEFNKYFDDTYDAHTYEALEDVLRKLELLP